MRLRPRWLHAGGGPLGCGPHGGVLRRRHLPLTHRRRGLAFLVEKGNQREEARLMKWERRPHGTLKWECANGQWHLGRRRIISTQIRYSTRELEATSLAIEKRMTRATATVSLLPFLHVFLQCSGTPLFRVVVANNIFATVPTMCFCSVPA